MAQKPDKFPDWATEEEIDEVSGQANFVEPPDFRKGSGWTRREIPPRQWFNWLARKTGLWFRWVDFTISDAGYEVFDEPGVTSWPVPDVLKSGSKKARVTVIGGGGSGGGVGGGDGEDEAAEAGGGGGGESRIALLDLTGIEEIEITVGAGGDGALPGEDGNDGGASSFGDILVAAPGLAGTEMSGGLAFTGADGGFAGSDGVGGAAFKGCDGNIGRRFRDRDGSTDRAFTSRQNSGGGSAFSGQSCSFEPTSTGKEGKWPGGGSCGARQLRSTDSFGSEDGADGAVIVEW